MYGRCRSRWAKSRRLFDLFSAVIVEPELAFVLRPAKADLRNRARGPCGQRILVKRWRSTIRDGDGRVSRWIANVKGPVVLHFRQ